MKKISLILAISIMVLSVNAQLFLGGSAGIKALVMNAPMIENTTFSYPKDGNDYLVGISFSPRIGFYVKEKLALGVDFSVGAEFQSITRFYETPWGPPYSYINEEIIFQWRIAPFLRGTVFTHKKFSLLLEGTIGAGGAHFMQSDGFAIGVGVLNIVPVLAYKLSDRFQLEATLNFLNLGYNIGIVGTTNKNSDNLVLLHDFNIGFNSKNVFVMSQFTVGFIYKFKKRGSDTPKVQ